MARAVSALSKDLVAASATPLILAILRRGDSYGYAIIQQVRDASDQRVEWAEGMLYPVLHRLEKKRWVESYWGSAPETGRRRKYYRLRKDGAAELERQYQQWTEITNLLHRLTEGEANV